MTDSERAELIRLLTQSQQDFLAAVDGVGATQWTYKPAPDRWSVGEVAEHIMLAEGSLFARSMEALAHPPNSESPEQTARKSEFLRHVMPRRNRKAIAPDHIQPRGMALAEVVSRYRADRARTLQFARETKLPLHEFTADHHLTVFGTLNAYQWLMYIPLHNLRHVQQIVEIQADGGYPQR